jgi:hypothetical protein
MFTGLFFLDNKDVVLPNNEQIAGQSFSSASVLS